MGDNPPAKARGLSPCAYEKACYNYYLSYDVAVNQWLTSCHRMTTRVITLWLEDVTSLTTSVSTMCFLIEIMFVLKAIKYNFKGSYEKQNLTLVVTTGVRSSI